MIYFDAAATTFQKPPAVMRAMEQAMKSCSSPGRGGYTSAEKAADVMMTCRWRLMELFHAKRPEQVVFTQNATHGLNIAIHSLVKPGSTVVVSGYEHNAVTRPLHAIKGVTIHVVNTPLFDPKAMVEGFETLVTKDVSAVICTHVSNVFGYILPIEEIGAICRKKGVPLIVDASQSAGILPVSMEELGAAFVAMPGHKGLYGPQGTGVLLCGGEAEPLLCGGTGSSSKEQEMPDFLPDRLEAGTPNVVGIAGLSEGVGFVQKTGEEKIYHHGVVLKNHLLSMLRKKEHFRVFGSENHQAGVVSFLWEGVDTEELSDALSEAGFALRGGFHCAPFAHKTAGTYHTGTVRFSVSAFNSMEEVTHLGRYLCGIEKI